MARHAIAEAPLKPEPAPDTRPTAGLQAENAALRAPYGRPRRNPAWGTAQSRTAGMGLCNRYSRLSE
jgi:hypothetical protein